MENYNELQNFLNFEELLSNLKKSGNNKSEQGTLFELFCKKVLQVAPFFADDVNEVWTWKEFPGNAGMHDTGIDLVVKDKQDNYWAIQCKFYDRDAKISKADIDSFISASTRPFNIDGVSFNFTQKFVFSTTEDVSLNSSNLFTLIGPEILKDCGIDWSRFSLDDLDNVVVYSKKTPKEHQKQAIENTIKGFETNNRGRLIMACGTGKTFTSLKIVERLFNNWKNLNRQINVSYNILYLVPSIALLSQTIIEWKTQQQFSWNVRTFGVCSDETAGQEKSKKNRKEQDELLATMPIPASTDVKKISKAYKEVKSGINIFFSTYQSIDVISKVAKENGIVFDIAVCDEAHRTIGAFKQNDDDSSNFVKIHNDLFVPCKKRLYMTATEKIYSSNAKQEAEDGGWSVYSMDDEKIYGPTFYYLSFGEAVTKQLLTDYRLLVLNIRKSDVAKLKLPESAFQNLDDASRIVGSLTALSKIPSELSPDEFKLDPNPMKRAVAFCSTIAQAKAVAESYNHLADEKCLGKEYMESQGFIIPKAKLITGNDNTKEKNKLLNWLRGNIEDGTCHILTNARCLSEGVDVPSLDSVIFMAKKRSQVDIIQAVGRVMRKFGSGNEKKYGYIIIPVVINDEKLTDKTLSNSDEYKVVWQVVQALRSHDERLDTEINKIGVTGKMPNSICFVNTFVPPVSRKGKVVGSLKKERGEGLDTDDPSSLNGGIPDFTVNIPSDEELKKNEQLFSAQLVKHCGNRLYWEDWSKNIGDVTNNIALKIKNQVETEEKAKKAFNKFHDDFKKLLNPSISELDAINMLAEHVVTLPVLKAIFNENSMIDSNPVTQIMESMVKKLSNFDKEIEELQPFYDSVKRTVQDITSSEGRQEIIRKLFEKFFQYALPKSAEKFGIVYTPVEIVDFIINSVSDVLKNEFGESITNPGIKVLDPFTGTGTFIVRLLDKLKELGINNEDLTTKYNNDIWCNEIMLLSYYIALINIEDTYGKLSGGYKPFNHAVLTDTFQMAEKRRNKFYQTALFEDQEFNLANAKAKEEDEQDIRVIIGNPPYSIGQRNANDNNANNNYEYLNNRIIDTYSLGTKSGLIKGLFDSYIKAFRWASDRIGTNGILSFVSNGSYIYNSAFDGFRRELLKEFNHIYVFNLKGNFRKYDKNEGENVFGNGCGTTICIVVLIKKQNLKLDKFINYKEIGEGLKTKEKLKKLCEMKSIYTVDWNKIYPDKNNDWLNQRKEYPSNSFFIGSKNDLNDNSIFGTRYSLGISTNRDLWIYNLSKIDSMNNGIKSIESYNNLLDSNAKEDDPLFYKNIKWTTNLNKLFKARKKINSKNFKLVKIMYRPFVKKWMYFNPGFIERKSKWNFIFDENEKNIILSISGIGANTELCTLITDTYIDLHLQDSSTQCFPLYWHDNEGGISLLDNFDNYSISNIYLHKAQVIYVDNNLTKENIFYFIYGLFNSNGYKTKYSNNLKKELPKLPFVKNYKKYIEIGNKLANLHINYETTPAYKGVQIIIKKEDYTVSKIRFLSKDRKDTIIFNDYITISNIPLEAYDYVVNGRSPIEWVMDQYQYSVDKDSGIVNDPNKFNEEKGGKYVFDLILSLITVSLETLKLINELPPYEEI